jgi:hypothetical protein
MLAKVRRGLVVVPHEAKHAANVQRLRTRRPRLTVIRRHGPREELPNVRGPYQRETS